MNIFFIDYDTNLYEAPQHLLSIRLYVHETYTIFQRYRILFSIFQVIKGNSHRKQIN